MNNITNYSHQIYDFKLSNYRVFDFQLADSHNIVDYDSNDNLIMDLTLDNGLNLVSIPSWDAKVVEIEPIPNYGLTGVDNGMVLYVTDESFEEALIPPSDTTFKPVNGSRRGYDYTIDYVDNIIEFKGGFYQAFYKLEGYNHQTLPNRFKDGWTIETKLFPDSTIPVTNTINEGRENNKGFFFYMGTRAENKFWNTFEPEIGYEGVLDEDFIIPLNPPRVLIKKEDNQFLIYGRSNGTTMCGTKIDTGFGTKRAGDGFKSGDTLLYKSYVPLNSLHDINPFLVYGRSGGKTMCGNEKDNEYGETIANTGEHEKRFDMSKELDIYGDIIDNAMGLRVTPEGAIAYRRISGVPCDNVDTEVKYIIEEDKTKDGIITDLEWNDITIKWVPDIDLDCEFDELRNGKLYVYVGHYLKHVFLNVTELRSEPLNENKNKQLGVPYNISVGGGTQGLLETLTIGGIDISDDDLPIATNFAGSFMGKMDGFKLYDKALHGCVIKSF